MKSEYGISPTTDTDASLSYRLSNDYITAISFKYNSNEEINYIQVRLVQDIDTETVNKELQKAYNLIDYSNDTYYFQNSDGKLLIYYMPAYSAIQFKVI